MDRYSPIGNSKGKNKNTVLFCEAKPPGHLVIPPFLMGLSRRIHAAVFSFMAGVIPPIAMLGRSLLYVQSHFVA